MNLTLDRSYLATKGYWAKKSAKGGTNMRDVTRYFCMAPRYTSGTNLFMMTALMPYARSTSRDMHPYAWLSGTLMMPQRSSAASSLKTKKYLDY